jgi:hypothetical protein
MHVLRIDSRDGWGMNLEFNCNGKRISVGTSHHERTKIIMVDNIGMISDVCPHVVDHHNWIGRHGSMQRQGWGWWSTEHWVPYGDRFKITGSGCFD